MAPKSTVAFISVVTDRSSSQWQQALALVGRFPGAQQALAQRPGKDVLSALGPELDVVVLNAPGKGGSSDVVLLTQPKDPAKLNSAVSKGTVHAVVDGWTAYAPSQAILKKFEAERSSGSLSDDKTFKDGYGSLPSDALAKAYVRGSVIEQRLRQSLSRSGLAGASSITSSISSNSGQLQSLSAALVPQQTGVKLNLNGNGNLPGKASTFSPELPSVLPSGALVYVAFSNLESSLQNALQRLSQVYPQVDAVRAQLEAMGGFSVDKDLLPLFAGEGAVAVYPSPVSKAVRGPAAAPTVDVVFKISDQQAALRVLNGLRLLSHFSKTVHVVSSKGVWHLMYRKTTIAIAAHSGLLIITNHASSLASIEGGTSKLADDAAYKQAVEGANLPSHTSGFVYVNTPLVARDALQSSAAQSHRRVSPQALAVISHLEGLLLYSHKNGGNYELTGFLGIK